jgi:hypothetical protein
VLAAAIANGGAAAATGATLDRSAFVYERAIPNASGLAALRLDAHVITHARRGLDDVRIADAKNQQVPYVAAWLAAPLVVPIAIPRRTRSEGTRSVYELTLSDAPLRADMQLVLTAGTAVFERHIALRSPLDERHGREARQLLAADWRGIDPGAAPPQLTLDLSCCTGPAALELLVDEGDNAPLPIVAAELRMPAAELRFYHPGTPLVLLYGNAAAAAPRYDLALLASRIAAQKAQPLTLGAPPAARPSPDETGSKQWFWVALVVAVAALLALLARLIAAR